MKRSLYILIIGLSFSNCEVRWEKSADLNTSPKIAFLINGETIDPVTKKKYESLEDSIKIGVKPNLKTYIFDFKADDENLSNFYFDTPDGEVISFTEKENALGNYQVIYEPKMLGQHIVTITAMDHFVAQSSIILKLWAYENLLPVASFTYTKKGIIRPGHFEVNATQSFDQDEKYGGQITRYQFEIDGNVINTPNASVEYIFQKEGPYEIKLKVQDNDGEWGEEIKEVVTIEF
ncbi:MAG: PKD domain-containing protein [Flammeovirgaceae bacterium]|nr:PKD domain-containing protein [Flammeovirgaceae bacterium]